MLARRKTTIADDHYMAPWPLAKPNYSCTAMLSNIILAAGVYMQDFQKNFSLLQNQVSSEVNSFGLLADD